MAKNFGQYDDDNPVMAILGKARLEEEISKSGNSEKESVSISSENEGAETPDGSGKTEEKAESPEIKKILVNISIRETTKKDWKMFFLEHDLTMTQGIETAVEYLRAEVEKGNIRLSKGGVTK